VRPRAGGVVAFSLSVLLLGAAPSLAQSPPGPPAAPSSTPPPPVASAPAPPPAPGFMPPYEVTKLVRSAGFNPLAPPLREGSTYVLRATDFRGILMRVVVDAHSGAIRAVNRIVSGPEPYGPIGMAAPPYGMLPPYGVQPPYGPQAYAPEMTPEEAALAPPPPALRTGTHPFASGPPLPRPRPAELAARDTKAGVKSSESPTVKPQADPGTAVPPTTAKRQPPPEPINE
jgi:hypothetical protein